jgi:hypothetical protein
MRRSTRGFTNKKRRLPSCDMIEVRLRTRSGWRIASDCAIMPPIDTPSTCARSMPNASSKPAVSSAMSMSV